MWWDAVGADEPGYIDKHFLHLACLRPGQHHDSPVWNTYIRLLVDPFADDHDERRYCHEDQFHELILETWSDAGVDNDVTIEHKRELSTGTSAARGSRIDYLVHHDDGHRVGVEIKAAGWRSYEVVQE